MSVLLLSPYSEELIPIVGDDVTVLDQGPCSIDLIKSLAPDIVVSYGHRHIVSEEVIKAIDGRAVNLHISLLPWNRGADPNLWSWLSDTPKGVTIHRLTSGLDQGPVIAQEPVTFDEAAHTLRTSYLALHNHVLALLADVWHSLVDGSAVETAQVGTGSYHRASDKDSLLDQMPLGWDTPCSEVAELGRHHGFRFDQAR